MESYTVCQLQRDMRFEGFLLIRSAEKRKDSKGSDYVDMNLTDRTGEINCKIWNWDPEAETPEAGQPIKVRGTVQEYNGRLQLRVEKWRLCREDDLVDMNALVPCAPRKPEDMMSQIEETVESFSNEDIVVSDREYRDYAERNTGIRLSDQDAALSVKTRISDTCEAVLESDLHAAYLMIDDRGFLVDNTLNDSYVPVADALNGDLEAGLRKLSFNDELYRSRYSA